MHRYLLTLITALFFTAQAHAAAVIGPAFSHWSSASGGVVDASKQGTNTMIVQGAMLSKPGGKPTMSVSQQADVVYALKYATLADADSAAVAAGKQLVISTQWDTVPSTLNAAIKILPGGKINNSGPLTISGQFEGVDGCFIGSGPVSIPNVPFVYPDYWQSNTVPGTTDMLAAYNAAKTANTKVVLKESTYHTTGTFGVDGNRIELSGSSLRSWITKSGNFPAISVTGTRNVVSNLTVISTGGDGNILEVQGATYFDIKSVRVSGSGNGTIFPNNDVAVAYDNTAYGVFDKVHGYNAKIGMSDLGGNNGAVAFTDSEFFTNDVNLDVSGPSNTFIGGTISHANTTEIKVGTRYATSTVYTTFLRGSLSLTGTHIEGNNTATNPMIVVGDSGSSSIANDVPTLNMLVCRMFLNSAARVPIQYNSGKSLTVNGLSFNGALVGNAGVIQTTTNYALRPTVSGASIGSGAAIPWYSLFATAKGDLIINSDPTNLFTIQSTKPTISVENTANSILDTFRVFTKDESGNNKERVMVQTGVDTADIKFTGTLKIVGTSNLGTSTFANLGSVPAAGTAVYCTNCTTAATCASGGSGHMAVSNGSNWTCQ